MPTIPATWEMEIGGLYFEASLGKKVTETCYRDIVSKKKL
jgi:hypothetical protein